MCGHVCTISRPHVQAFVYIHTHTHLYRVDVSRQLRVDGVCPICANKLACTLKAIACVLHTLCISMPFCAGCTYIRFRLIIRAQSAQPPSGNYQNIWRLRHSCIAHCVIALLCPAHQHHKMLSPNGTRADSKSPCGVHVWYLITLMRLLFNLHAVCSIQHSSIMITSTYTRFLCTLAGVRR